MPGSIKVIWIAEMPEELLTEFLQHVQDFNTAHPESHSDITANANLPDEEIAKAFDAIDPPFPIRRVMRKQ